MKQLILTAATSLTLALSPVISDANNGLGSNPQLDPPENVSCTIDVDAGIVSVMWGVVVDATKYALNFDCEDPTGLIEREVPYEPEERLEETFADVPFAEFQGIPLDGENAWTCISEVKGLNPPGRSQNNPKGRDICD